MDCIFNLQIPKSTEYEYIIRPNSKKIPLVVQLFAGKTFITGLASKYSLKYDPELLKKYITREEFTYMITCFNEVLFTYWPCPLCFGIGYMFSPCSLGLSFLCPNLCIADAETNVRASMEYFNKQKLKSKGLKVRLVKQCSTSWVRSSVA